MDLTLVQSAFKALKTEPPSPLSLLEAALLKELHVPPVPADVPLLITGISDAAAAAALRPILLSNYSSDHPVQLVSGSDVLPLSLGALGVEPFPSDSCLFVPALPHGTSLEAFAEVIAHLRAPDGCPWDREQTHASLRQHLLGESYEALSAMDTGDPAQMREEFGDLLLQIVLNAQIGHETGGFSLTQVLKGIHDKIIRRHPHVFGEATVSGVEHVLQNWEKLKEQERHDKQEQKGVLDGIPPALPALNQAQEYQERAARVGFDWPEIEGVLDKIAEEVREVQTASTPEHVGEEIGDLLFALVNLARWKKIDAESALRMTNLKFKSRFAYIEAGAKSQSRRLTDLTLDEMESLWQEAKKK